LLLLWGILVDVLIWTFVEDEHPVWWRILLAAVVVLGSVTALAIFFSR
jgi:hypothetical protein